MDAQAQPRLTAVDGGPQGPVIAKTAGEVAAEHAAEHGYRTPPEQDGTAGRGHVMSKDCSCGPEVVTVDPKDVAADLGAIDPAAVPSVERPDGRPGFTEQYAGATFVTNVTIASAADGERPPVAEKLRTPPPRRNPVSGGVLDEANRIIHGDRAEAYGPAEDSFARIAALWSVHLGQQIDAYDVSILMVLMKAARAKTDLGRDTFVDIAGYAALAPRCAAHAGRDGA